MDERARDDTTGRPLICCHRRAPSRHNVFWDSRYLYLLLPLCMGGDLYKLFLAQQSARKDERAAEGVRRPTRERPDGLREVEARFYVACVVGALAAVHARHIVYRDLKVCVWGGGGAVERLSYQPPIPVPPSGAVPPA